MWDTDIKNISEISEVSDFMTALHGWTCKKCTYGGSMLALLAQERIIYHTLQLEAEVNNGGFSQYFYHAFGDIEKEAVPSFEVMKAEKTVAIYKKAIDAVFQRLPSDRAQRKEVLDKNSYGSNQ